MNNATRPLFTQKVTILQFVNENKEYVLLANQFNPMYTLDSQLKEEFPDFKTMEFTGYKSRKFVEELEESGIPLDGSHWMYRLDFDNMEGWWIFDDLLKILFGSSETIWPDTDKRNVLLTCGRDPRARLNGRWRIATQEQVNKIKNLAHMYGVREHVTFSQIISVPREEEQVSE